MIKRSQLISDIRRGNILPVYLFYGEEEFLIREAVELIAQKVVDPATRDFNLSTIYCREASASDIIGIAQTLPFMATKRLIIARDIDAFKSADLEALIPYLRDPSPNTCLVMLSSQRRYDKKTVISAVEEGGGAVVAFYALKESDVFEWIIGWADTRGIKIASEAVHFIVQIVGNDLQKIKSELEKVEIYMKGRKAVTLEDARRVVGDFREYNPFDLAEAIGHRDVQKALLVLARLLQEGEEPVGLIGAIAWNMRRLLKAKAMQASGKGYEEIKKRLNVLWLHSASFMEQMNSFSEPELKEAFGALLQADRLLKTGGQEARLVLDGLILKLCGSRLPERA